MKSDDIVAHLHLANDVVSHSNKPKEQEIWWEDLFCVVQTIESFFVHDPCKRFFSIIIKKKKNELW